MTWALRHKLNAKLQPVGISYPTETISLSTHVRHTVADPTYVLVCSGQPTYSQIDQCCFEYIFAVSIAARVLATVKIEHICCGDQMMSRVHLGEASAKSCNCDDRSATRLDNGPDQHNMQSKRENQKP